MLEVVGEELDSQRARIQRWQEFKFRLSSRMVWASSKRLALKKIIETSRESEFQIWVSFLGGLWISCAPKADKIIQYL